MSLTKIWHKTWHDKYGNVVIWQRPNILLIGWLVCFFVSLFFSKNTAQIIEAIGLASLFLWGVLELISGVNYFRRAFGLFGILMVLFFVLHIFS